MKVAIINGSPKGEKSISLHYARYIAKRFPQHHYTEHFVAQRIASIERDENRFQSIVDDMAQADIILWAFPLYYMLVHSGLKRFVELLFEHDTASLLAGKVAGLLSTSIHFYDHTAHNYMRGISEDLGMGVAAEYAADMSDIREPGGREQMDHFARTLFDAHTQGRTVPRQLAPIVPAPWAYASISEPQAVDVAGRKVAIVHDALPEDTSLLAMVDRLAQSFAGEAIVTNLREISLAGGCLGCIRCGQDNECVYDGKDEHRALNELLKEMDIIVFAGAIHDRYLSSRWKMFFDRSFYNGHVPSLAGKQFVWALSGPLSQIANLREILLAYGEMQRSNVAALVSDEVGDADALDKLLDAAVSDAVSSSIQTVRPSNTSRGVAGHLLFRDAIWGRLRVVFRADHAYYRSHGAYGNFPQRNWATRLLNLVAPPLLRIPAAKKAMQDQMVNQMVARYVKLVAETEPAQE